MAREPKAKDKGKAPEVDAEVETSTGQALARIDKENILEGVDNSLAVSLVREEIDIQIATAKAYPRSMAKAIRNIIELATANTETAAECIYTLPRAGKAIIGPSIRFAELVYQQWGNARVAARVTVVDKREGYVEAVGIYHDLETNVAKTATIRRRIKDSGGRTFNDDMIGVTSNAACAIATRNAILTGIPKPIWKQAYDRCEQVIRGDLASLGARRVNMIAEFAKIGVDARAVFALVNVGGAEDIGLDEMVVLGGLWTSINDGTLSLDEALGRAAAPQGPGGGLGGAFAPREAVGAPQTAVEAQTPKEPSKPATAAQQAPAAATEAKTSPPQSVQTAEPDKATSASATDASTASPEETSGQQAQGEPSTGGELVADDDTGGLTAEAVVIDDERPAAEIEAELTALDENLDKADNWLTVKHYLGIFSRSPAMQAEEAEQWLMEGQRHALAKTQALIDTGDPVKQTEDIQFFSIWLPWAAEHAPELIKSSFAKLTATQAYMKLTAAQQRHLASEVHAACGGV